MHSKMNADHIDSSNTWSFFRKQLQGRFGFFGGREHVFVYSRVVVSASVKCVAGCMLSMLETIPVLLMLCRKTYFEVLFCMTNHNFRVRDFSVLLDNFTIL